MMLQSEKSETLAKPLIPGLGMAWSKKLWRELSSRHREREPKCQKVSSRKLFQKAISKWPEGRKKKEEEAKGVEKLFKHFFVIFVSDENFVWDLNLRRQVNKVSA